MEPLGVAVVGLGWWGRIIVPLLKDSAKLRVVCGVVVRPPEYLSGVEQRDNNTPVGG